MIRIGDYNELKVIAVEREGATVTDGDRDILVPASLCDDRIVMDATLSLFTYRNSNDQIVATCQTPKGVIGDFAAMKVVDETKFGAFLDWGLEKDLFVPHSQMLGQMIKGQTYVVRIIEDSVSNRVIATPRLRPFLEKADNHVLPEGTKITAMIYENRELGVMAIVNNKYQGMFTANEFSTAQKIGTTVEAYVKKYDDDGHLTISRAPVGHEGWSEAGSKLAQLMEDNDGFLPINDKSNPAEISRLTGMSKKSFKKVVGGLLKAKRLEITEGGIRLISDEE